MTTRIDHLIDNLQGVHPETAAHIEDLREVLEQVVGEVRDISQELAGRAGLREDLSRNLEMLATRIREQTGIICDLDLGEIQAALDPEVATGMFRIAQEAITNALRHAEACKLLIRLAQVEDTVKMEIEDDGRGIANEDDSDGLGLRTMRHRASDIGGSLELTSGRGGGTLVRCRVPV